MLRATVYVPEEGLECGEEGPVGVPDMAENASTKSSTLSIRLLVNP